MTTGPVTSIEVRKARAEERAAVKTTLAAAFRDEALFRWAHPDPEHRAERVHGFFDVLVDALVHHDDTWSAGPGVRGAALWVPFGQPVVPDEPALMAALLERAGPDAGRLSELMAQMDEQHPHEPHAYLWFIGVVPGAQGTGIGSALMSRVLEEVDRAGSPAYLEASSPKSKKLYEWYGFVAWEPFVVADDAPVWPMWREARAT